MWGIAQIYGTTVANIVTANEIPEPNNLVVGQTIVVPIPGRVYIVQPGDSLWSIGQKFGVNYVVLAQLNGLSINQPLQVGMKLKLPPMAKKAMETLAYIEPRGTAVSNALLQEARETTPQLTYLSLFSYEARNDGSLKAPAFAGLPEIARQNNATMMLVVSNLQNGNFNSTLAGQIFQSTAVQDLLFTNIIAAARRVTGVTDIHFDFENLQPNQRVGYNNFLRRATARLRPAGFTISTAVLPKVSEVTTGPAAAHDYKAHGEICDFVLLMTYEWGWAGGPPQAISPIREVERVIRYAMSVMPASKIYMGQNLYGYDWTLPYQPGGKFAVALSPQQAIERAKQYKAAIQYDVTSQAPFFRYVDAQGRSHIVWFEDARSIQAKFDLTKRLNIRGIGYWKLGLSMPQNWLLIEDNFQVVKL